MVKIRIYYLQIYSYLHSIKQTPVAKLLSSKVVKCFKFFFFTFQCSIVILGYFLLKINRLNLLYEIFILEFKILNSIFNVGQNL